MKKITVLLNKIAACFCVFTLVFLSVNFVGAQEKSSISATPKTENVQPKFALLVGITKYKSDKINKIDGCENNVPALRETLVKDYGFGESNVLTLLNEKATKEAIISNFRTHLIENAKKVKGEGKEAVIVYYFCGHGSQFPDQDGDENDDKDETFVAYDSRTGDVFDILDDELDDLKAELRPLTTNTMLILESCHSGTGSRGDNEYISEETSDDQRERKPYKRKFPPSTDADSLTYTEIAASLSTNTAKSESAEYCKCEKPMSLMTKALVQGLKRATNNTTYRNLTREISSEVAAQSRQEPQVEGNRDAVLFGGAAQRAKPYIEVEKVLSDNQIVIRAGKIHGLKVGSQISVYSSDSLTNTGKEGWLTNGTVIEVGSTASVVELPKENPKVKEVKNTSHIVLASPVFGGGSVLLALNPNGTKTLNESEILLQKNIEDKLKNEGLIENQIIKLVPSENIGKSEKEESKGIIRLRKAKFKDVFFTPNTKHIPTAETFCDGNEMKTKLPEKTAADDFVYYLDEGEAGGVPLFGKVFNPTDGQFAAHIAESIRNYVYQNNLKSLDNAASDISSQIKVSFEIFPGEISAVCSDGKKNYDTSTLGKSQLLKNYEIPVGAYFRLDIKNVSGEKRREKDEYAAGEPYHITVLSLNTTGDIEIVYSSNGANDPLGDGKEINRLNKVLFKATEPIGIERYIIIISKDYVDFSFYQSNGTKRNAKSILERMLTQSGKQTRDSGTISDEPDKWDVIHLELNVVNKID